jgi:hypothetical protein
MMLSSDDHIIKRIYLILLFIIIAGTRPVHSQSGILDSAYTFRAGTLKTGTALNMISRQTGYYFTYDSRLVYTEKKTGFTFFKVKLKIILDSLLKNDSLQYSVINRYIIIYKSAPSASRQNITPEWEVKSITGVITDNESGEPLPYATIGIMSTGRGTVTNNNGEFGLKISRDCVNDSLSVSYLGYFSRKIPVRSALDNNLNIRMYREYISIPEIIIKNQVPQEIMRKAYNAVQENYGTTPALMTAFYREAAIKKGNLQIYSEAVLQIFKSPYSSSLLNDQVKIIRSRKIENTGLKDTLTMRLKAGLSSCLMLDGARNTFDFLFPGNFAQYDYRMTDIVTLDEESAYVIEFVQKPAVDIPLYKGSVYINTSNFAIIQAEFEINPAYISKSREDFVTNPSRGYSIWPVSVKYNVSYRKIGERYFLNHARGELNFNAKQKRRLFNSSFEVFFELAVTDIRLNNVTRFDRDEIAPVHSIFSKTITSYDPDFWGTQDFLKPEDNLLLALKNMKVKLQEFSK